MNWEHAQRMARVREKEAHPERFCWQPRCLKGREECREHGPAQNESWIRGYAACLNVIGDYLPAELRSTATEQWDKMMAEESTMEKAPDYDTDTTTRP